LFYSYNSRFVKQFLTFGELPGPISAFCSLLSATGPSGISGSRLVKIGVSEQPGQHPVGLWVVQLYSATAEQSLNTSGAALKPYGYLVTFNDNRDFAGPLGIFQHGIQSFRMPDHIDVLHLTFFLKGFTSRYGVRSSILSINQGFVRHRQSPSQ
jgi:hypothetical protein